MVNRLLQAAGGRLLLVNGPLQAAGSRLLVLNRLLQAAAGHRTELSMPESCFLFHFILFGVSGKG
jgi:hypothetical protein